jgi:cytochrome c5
MLSVCRLFSFAVTLTAACLGDAAFTVEADAPSVTELTVEQAIELAGTRGDLELNHLRVLSPQVAELLARSSTVFELNGLTSLSPESAATLSQPDVTLELDSLTDLPWDTARALITPTSPRSLSLRGLTGINDEVAELMGQHGGFLRLSGLSTVTDRQLELLAAHRGYLGLSGLTNLSVRAATALGRHTGLLSLNGVESLTPEAAAALAGHGQFLRLDGLQTISDEVATALARHKGPLGLHGVTTLSDAAAELLARHEGTLYLMGMETLSDRAVAALRANPDVRLPARFRPLAPADGQGVTPGEGETLPADHQSERTKALIAAGRAVDAGKLEIESRFHLARPMWSYDGLETLNVTWAEEAIDEAERSRLNTVREFSPAWWREMNLRYGMHPPVPESHQDFTVALGIVRTQAHVVGGSGSGLVANCRICHSTMLFTSPDPRDPEPRFAEGIPNPFLDFERFHQNVAASGDTSPGFLFAKNLPRFFVDSADFFGILVPVVRPDGIKPSPLRYEKFFVADHGSNYTKRIEGQVPLIPFLKPQPWTNYKYKTAGSEGKGLYVDGGFEGNVADVTYAMALSRDHLGNDYAEARGVFRQSVPEYFRSLSTPRYPFIADVREEAADAGHEVFMETCARCHGDFTKTGPKTYDLVNFPNKLVDHDELGTDPLRITGVFDMNAEEKKRFLSGKVTTTHRYAAPPLVGIWARGPYLHNASVPTVYNLLKSSTRPRKYSMRPSSTDPTNYDQARIGWKFVDESSKSHQEILEQMEREPYLRVFDPDWRSPEQWEALRQALADVKHAKVDLTKPELYTGMLNTGHTFGDNLTEEQRLAVLEFLKCL